MSTRRITNGSWLLALPQLVVLAGLIVLFKQLVSRFDWVAASMMGASVFLSYSYSVRRALTKHHRLGIRAVKLGEFKAAVGHFQQSIRFFERFRWIDRFRAVTMLSPSGWEYREMGMMNIAFAYSKSGNSKAARRAYEALLAAYPHNAAGQRALAAMDRDNEKSR